MGAGATKQQIYRGVRKMLLGKQRELAEQGVGSTYRLGGLRADNEEYWTVRVIRASNGECAGVLVQVKGETMAVRNWWIEVTIDGRKHKLVGGPQAKDGGFTVVIFQRDEGRSIPVLEAEGNALLNGDLQFQVQRAGTTDDGFIAVTKR